MFLRKKSRRMTQNVEAKRMPLIFSGADDDVKLYRIYRTYWGAPKGHFYGLTHFLCFVANG
jgi:hypothetical protein